MTEALAKCLRVLAKARFKLLGLATIRDISTDRFNDLVDRLVASGWRCKSEYSGFDAWIDYGKIKLRKGRAKLTLEWDNWTEGSVEGPRRVVEEIARENQLPISYEWRWSDYDDN